ncbi:MAG: LPS-assembly protein LptD [Acidobacteria bacterium]|nr:LPS-assembly protein LptD [Acidobacteriota bacterium]
MRVRAWAAAGALAACFAAAPPVMAQAATPSPTRGQPGARKKPPRTKFTRPGPNETPLMSAGHIEQPSAGEYVLTNEVDFRYGGAHLLADSAHYSESERTVTAEGNVVIQLADSEISGDRAEFDLDSGEAVIDNARAYIEPDLIVNAAKMQRVGEQSYRITDATVTSCTQPTPYWSFWVGTAIVHVGHYAHLRDAVLRVGKIPIFWSPYLAIPVKEDRAAGLLFPHFGFSQKRGAFLSNALYVPVGRSFDSTLQVDSFGGAISNGVEELPSTAFGLETRFVPNAYGSGTITTYFLREKLRPFAHSDIVDRDRYQVRMNYSQQLPAGFKLLADLDDVSDLNYFIDFEHEIRYSSNPTVLSQLDLSRLSGPYAVNVRFNQQTQFLGVVDPIELKIDDLALLRLPEVEMRGRGIRLGKTPFYLTYLASFDGLVRRENTFDAAGNRQAAQATYDRFDVFPTITGNFTPVPWLDISPIVSFRDTFYTASDSDPGSALDPTGPAINRQQYRAGFSIVGPRIYRLFGSEAEGKTRYKNTLEPRITYDYVPEVAGGEKIIPFDEIDATLGTSNLLTYSLTTRLFQKKPPQAAPGSATSPALTGSLASLVIGEEAPTRNQELVAPAERPVAPGAAPEGAAPPPAPESPPASPSTPVGGEAYLPSDVSTGPSKRTPLFGGPPQPARPLNVGPVEIASFELSQGYSLANLRPLSRSLALDANSQYSPITATARYNPTFSTSLDLRANYDILFRDISTVSLSGSMRSKTYDYLRMSWVFGRDLEGVRAGAGSLCATDGNRLVGREGPEQARCFVNTSQVHLLGGLALFGRKITTDVEIAYDVENSFLQNQRYRFGYNTQCCGVLLEVDKRALPSGSIGSTSDVQYRFVVNLRGVGTFLDVNGRPQ